MRLEIKPELQEDIQIKQLNVSGKTLQQYSYGSVIKTRLDNDVYREMSNRGLDNIALQHFTFPRALDLLAKRTKSLNDIFPAVQKKFRMADSFKIIEPSMEYMIYNVKSEREKFLQLNDLPLGLKDIMSDKPSIAKVGRLFGDNGKKEIAGIVEWSLEKQIKLGATIPISVCLPVSDTQTLEWAFTTNKISQSICNSNGWAETAFFNLDFSLFADETYLEIIRRFILQSNPSVVILKIRDANFTAADKMLERSNYFDFIANTTSQERMTFLLNSDSLGHLSFGLGNGIDVYTEPMDGTINTDIRMRKSVKRPIKGGYGRKFGRYLNPQDMIWWPFRPFVKYYENKGKIFPCQCDECVKLNGKDIHEDSQEWNMHRRRHALLERNIEITEMKQTFMDGTSRGAFFDRFSKSPLNSFATFFS